MDEEYLNTGDPVAVRSKADLIFGIFIIILAVVFFLWVIPASVRVPSSVDAAPLSPAFLPYTLTALIGVMGLICCVQAQFGRGVPKEESELTFVARSDWIVRFTTLIAIFVMFYLLPDVIGMLLMSIISMSILVFVGGERNLLRGLLVSILLPFCIWLFFTRVAQVPLPLGLLEGYLPI